MGPTRRLSASEKLRAEVITPRRKWTIGELQTNPEYIPSTSAIYAWWSRSPLPHIDPAGLHIHDRWTLLYIGIVPRKPYSRNSRKPRNLRDRLRNHCRGPSTSSTFRRSLMCLLATELRKLVSSELGETSIEKQEKALTKWMIENLSVSWAVTSEPWIAETDLLNQGPRLPLNIKGSRDPFVLELKRMRRLRL